MSLTTFTTDKLKAFAERLEEQRLGLCSPMREYILESDEWNTSVGYRNDLDDIIRATKYEMASRGC